jgi:hypothetical protein
MTKAWRVYARRICGLMTLAFLPAVSSATTWTIVNTNDSGTGSLRDAVTNASSGDTINFNLSPSAAIVLTSGTLTINTNLTITGPATIQGGGQIRIFLIGAAEVSIYGVTISKAAAFTTMARSL